ncbi:MAG: hypothetical protein KKG04_03975, partial [Candidatus Thermoplasmatota archaeon]|nr:hypothetical protein [Candidatus Thermoplasmatota archaeon]
VNPTFFNIEDILTTIDVLPEFFMLAVQFILLIILIEWTLRIGLFVKHFVFSGSRAKPSRSTNPASS